jgi:hypothetical protein
VRALCRQTPFYRWPGDKYTLLDNEEGFQGLQYSKRRQYIPHSVLVVEIFLGRRISFSPSSMYPVVDVFPVIEFFLIKSLLLSKMYPNVFLSVVFSYLLQIPFL